MRKIIMAVVLGFVLAGSVADGNETNEWFVIRQGFMSGNDYRKLSLREQRIYLMGVYDGLAMNEHAARFMRVTDGIIASQFRAIVETNMAENPETWHAGMNLIVYRTLKELYERSTE